MRKSESDVSMLLRKVCIFELGEASSSAQGDFLASTFFSSVCPEAMNFFYDIPFHNLDIVYFQPWLAVLCPCNWCQVFEWDL